MRTLIMALVLIAVIGCHSTPQRPTTPKESDMELGNRAFMKGDYKKTIEYYNVWLGKYPNDADVLFQRGRANYQLAKYEDAHQDFDKSLKYYPKNLRPAVYDCGVMIALDKYDLAQRAVQSVLTHPLFSKLPRYELFLIHLYDGTLKNNEKNYDQALMSINKSIEIYNLHPDKFRNNGSNFIKRLALYERVRNRLETGQIDHPEFESDMTQYIAMTKQAGYKVEANDYKTLAVTLYLTKQYDKCKDVLVHLDAKDRQALSEAVGDAFFTQR